MRQPRRSAGDPRNLTVCPGCAPYPQRIVSSCRHEAAPLRGRGCLGILFRDQDHHVIGVNSARSLVRQRFTIAHELGHRALHPGRELILDAPVRVSLRDKTSSMASDEGERWNALRAGEGIWRRAAASRH
jgi:hypothetical protein